MRHFELRFSIPADETISGMLMYALGEAGCNSFMEVENLLFAYIVADKVNDAVFERIPEVYALKGVAYQGQQALPEKNWNAQWEAGYEPVNIAGKCIVRAPFHKADPDVEHDIIIMPRMSFGTAHHETTALMIELLLEEDVNGKTVLDMGCGTAVLAILANKLGASHVLAIDNDEWAYSNAQDNVKLNAVANVKVEMGEARLLSGRKFDLILANINRNVLLADLNSYTTALNRPGTLIMSGFYKSELEIISSAAHGMGFELYLSREMNNWTAAVYQLRSG
jgi:ribosomal protein L11 methyltransferase